MNKKILTLNEELKSELENALFQQREEEYLESLHKMLDKFEEKRLTELD